MTSVDSVEKIETHDMKRIFRQNDKHGYVIFNLPSWYVRVDKVSCNIKWVIA